MDFPIITTLLFILLVTEALFDIRTMQIPVWLVCFNLILGVISVLSDLIIYKNNISDYIVSMALILVIFVAALLFKLLKTEAIGLGDGLLMISLALIIKGGLLIFVIGISMILAGLFAGCLLILKKAGRKSRFLNFVSIFV